MKCCRVGGRTLADSAWRWGEGRWETRHEHQPRQSVWLGWGHSTGPASVPQDGARRGYLFVCPVLYCYPTACTIHVLYCSSCHNVVIVSPRPRPPPRTRPGGLELGCGRACSAPAACAAGLAGGYSGRHVDICAAPFASASASASDLARPLCLLLTCASGISSPLLRVPSTRIRY